MKTNTPSGQDPAASQAKTIILEHLNQSLKKEIEILQGYELSEGMKITNLFEMLDEQISIGIDKTEMLPEDKKKDDILKTLYHMDVLLRIITDKVDDKLFWAIDNVIFELTEKRAEA